MISDDMSIEIRTLSNVLFTQSGFKSEQHQNESLNALFFAGYDPKHPLREVFRAFNLSAWEKERFALPQIGIVKILGSDLHRIQRVAVKLIYNKQSPLDENSFDAIPSVFFDFERELPADISADLQPLTIIENAQWIIMRLRAYQSPTCLDRITRYDFL